MGNVELLPTQDYGTGYITASFIIMIMLSTPASFIMLSLAYIEVMVDIKINTKSVDNPTDIINY